MLWRPQGLNGSSQRDHSVLSLWQPEEEKRITTSDGGKHLRCLKVLVIPSSFCPDITWLFVRHLYCLNFSFSAQHSIKVTKKLWQSSSSQKQSNNITDNLFSNSSCKVLGMTFTSPPPHWFRLEYLKTYWNDRHDVSCTSSVTPGKNEDGSYEFLTCNGLKSPVT